MIPLAMQHYTLLQQNPIYTGITRGKRKGVRTAPVSLAQEASVTSAPASGTGTMERGSPPPVIDSGGKV